MTSIQAAFSNEVETSRTKVRFLILRPVRTVLWISGSFILVIVFGQLLLRRINLQTRKRAESLLEDIRRLKPGASTTSDVQRILDSYQGQKSSGLSSACSAPDSSYSVRVSHDRLNQIGRSLPILRPYGVRPWSVKAMFLLKDGLLCYLEY